MSVNEIYEELKKEWKEKYKKEIEDFLKKLDNKNKKMEDDIND